MQNFIMEFKQALSDAECLQLLNKFNASTQKQQGKTGAGVDISKKDSTDLYISEMADWSNEVQLINQRILMGLMHYCRQYPFILVGAIAASAKDAAGKLKTLTAEDVQKMDDQNLAQLIQSIYTLDAINLQHYQKAKGGYHHWHSEHFPHPTDPKQRSLRRVLLWLLYLNDVEKGGTTDFFYQNARVQPTKGSLILAPCGFTHTHRGAVPESSDKYVLASWVMYRTPEELYGR